MNNPDPIHSAGSSADQPLALQMQGIYKSFFGVPVLKNVDFDVYHGEVHVLLGENGAGKSTLMKILSAAYKADAGRILIDGQEYHFNHPQEAQRAGISTIYQHLSQTPHLSVAENIFLGDPPLTPLGLLDWSEMRREARRALDLVGATIDGDAIVKNLSVAERQLVEIATAMRRQARILIMDEPTAALTERETGRLFELIRQLKAKGVGIIYISHRLEEVAQVGDRVTVLRDGQIIGTQPVGTVSVVQLVSMMVGRDIQHTSLPPLPGEVREALRVENLSRPGHFDNISFGLNWGEIVGLAGLVGAGRTALAEAIAGAAPAASGQIYVDGQPAAIRHSSDATHYGLGFATEDRARSGLCLALSVRENMTLPLLARWRESLGRFWLNRQREVNLTNNHARELAVRAHDLGESVRYLSGGNQQKVIIAKWLMARCRILILDEPTLGIDVGAKEEIHRLMVRFAREQGGAVLLVSSDLPEVLKLSDRVLVMAQGRLQGVLNRTEATEERIMLHAVAAVEGVIKRG
ncbi:MAG: sugar ABC transporter ATP-binding protein [Anaerolineales bacterium]|nr:sugar ABC transporter ATP-binding protein [Anaerolineales bacterium]